MDTENVGFKPGISVIIDEYMAICDGIEFSAGGYTGKIVRKHMVDGKPCIDKDGHEVYIIYAENGGIGYHVESANRIRTPDMKSEYHNRMKIKKVDKSVDVTIKCSVCGADRIIKSSMQHVIKKCLDCQEKLKKEKQMKAFEKMKKKAKNAAKK